MSKERTLKRIALVLAIVSVASVRALVAQGAQGAGEVLVPQVVQRDCAPGGTAVVQLEDVIAILDSLLAADPDPSEVDEAQQQNLTDNSSAEPVECIDQLIEAQGTVIYDAEILAEGPARVWVTGDGDRQLSIEVYDEDASLVASASSGDEHPMVTWSPRVDAHYQIAIRNLDDGDNAFTICTN